MNVLFAWQYQIQAPYFNVIMGIWFAVIAGKGWLLVPFVEFLLVIQEISLRKSWYRYWVWIKMKLPNKLNANSKSHKMLSVQSKNICCDSSKNIDEPSIWLNKYSFKLYQIFCLDIYSYNHQCFRIILMCKSHTYHQILSFIMYW